MYPRKHLLSTQGLPRGFTVKFLMKSNVIMYFQLKRDKKYLITGRVIKENFSGVKKQRPRYDLSTWVFKATEEVSNKHRVRKRFCALLKSYWSNLRCTYNLTRLKQNKKGNINNETFSGIFMSKPKLKYLNFQDNSWSIQQATCYKMFYALLKSYGSKWPRFFRYDCSRY